MEKINKTDEELRYCYKYPHPSVTTDCVIFGFDGAKLRVLLVQRGIEPYKGRWAFPGGFMKMDETVNPSQKKEAFLFRFNKAKYEELKQKGFRLEF